MPHHAGRPPVWQMIREAVETHGGRTTNVAVKDWILKHYPRTNVLTIRAQIIISTVNHPSRVHYPQNQSARPADRPHDFLFRTGRGRLEIYDPAKHGQWAIAETADGEPLPVRISVSGRHAEGESLCGGTPRARCSEGQERTEGGMSNRAVGALERAYRRLRSHELVTWRTETCVEPLVQMPTRADVWRGLALALCTSQQRSGPGTRVYNLWSADPCPLSLGRVQSWQPRIGKKVAEVLREWGGVRFYNRIGQYVERNYRTLYGDGLIDELDRLVRRLYGLRQLPADWNEDAQRNEREVCDQVLDLELAGIGNKQCRNWLQAIGLLRYEVPLDSRVLKFLAPFVSLGRLDYDRLGDPEYYEAAEDLVQGVCRRAGLLPCVGDAVMFLSGDEE